VASGVLRASTRMFRVVTALNTKQRNIGFGKRDQLMSDELTLIITFHKHPVLSMTDKSQDRNNNNRSGMHPFPHGTPSRKKEKSKQSQARGQRY